MPFCINFSSKNLYFCYFLCKNTGFLLLQTRFCAIIAFFTINILFMTRLRYRFLGALLWLIVLPIIICRQNILWKCKRGVYSCAFALLRFGFLHRPQFLPKRWGVDLGSYAFQIWCYGQMLPGVCRQTRHNTGSYLQCAVYDYQQRAWISGKCAILWSRFCILFIVSKYALRGIFGLSHRQNDYAECGGQSVVAPSSGSNSAYCSSISIHNAVSRKCTFQRHEQKVLRGLHHVQSSIRY